MTKSSVNQLHVLMLGEPDCGEEFLSWVDAHAQVEHVHTFEAALQALRAEPFDLIISQAADFIPFHGVHISEQAAAILGSPCLRLTAGRSWIRKRQRTSENTKMNRILRESQIREDSIRDSSSCSSCSSW